MASSTVTPQRVTLLALAVLSLSFPHLSHAASSPSLPREAAAAVAAGGGKASEQQPHGGGAAVAQSVRACTYTVKIKTSCSSPSQSSADAVSLAFGDAYRNEVYAARVTPRSGFERCATDTFRVAGPCGYGVCYLYLRRSGRAGWTPEWVRVYEPATSGTPSTFYYGDPLPDGVWYGFDRCVSAGAGASETGAAAQAL